MKLRRQLILLSLLTLVLPWAGLQYLSDMEAANREAEIRALTTGAQAVARLVASSDTLTPVLAQPASPDSLYAHPLNAAPVVDGYDDEWRFYPFLARRLAAGADLSADVQLAEFGQAYYLFVRVNDGRLRYHNPGQHPAASGDHLQLKTAAAVYWVSASAPGKAQVFQQLAGGDFRPDHRLIAHWQERDGGYQLELRLPKSRIGDKLALTVVSAGPGETPQRISSAAQTAAAAPAIVVQDALLNEVLQVFTGDNLRLMLLDASGWLRADVGEFRGQQADPYDAAPHNGAAYSWLWRSLLRKPAFDSWHNVATEGRLPLRVQARDQQWLQLPGQLLARAQVPVQAGDQLLGYVVAEQAAEHQDAASASALLKLMRYSLLAVLVTGAALLGYASWLSFRVRRLSRSVASALGEGGQLRHQLPESKSGDELGDLSRDISGLLKSLREYTDYLRTLSSKLSHELRTPLAVVKSSLENLQHADSADQQQLYQQRASAGAERLSAILNAMSAASRLEESLAHSEPEAVELHLLVQELARAYTDSFGRPVTARASHAISATLVPDLLVQALDKLVENAVDFCPPDGAIRLLLERQRGVILLSVENDGPLLPAQMQNQLFDSLVSVRAEKSPERSHLGLGLHLVKLIAEYHGGTALAHNRNDRQGVIFTITLPLKVTSN